MSDFFKTFLVEEARRYGSSGRYAALAAFGKHPGWDDHVEDLGLETESLNLAKTVFYVNGIGGQIDSGAWEKLEPAQQLPVFKHVFVWQRGGQILVGRLWSSSDGKGRKRYPLVVCAHFMGVTLGWALKQTLPILAEIEERCVQTTSKEDVRALLGRKRAALREATQSTDGRGEYAPVSPEVLHRIIQPAAGEPPEGFLRVLYQLQGQLNSFGPGRFNARANPAALRAQQIRVPVAGDNPEQALLFWTRFFLTQVDTSVPMLLTLPLEENWLDVTVGEPESHEFFCLRATPKAVPLVSEVPYKLDDSFRARATAFLTAFQRGETAGADLRPAAPASEQATPARGGWFKWFGLVMLVVVGGIATVVMLPEGSNKKPEAKATQTNLAVAKLEIKERSTSATNTTVAAGQDSAQKAAEVQAARLAEEKRQAAAKEAARLAEERKQAATREAAAKLKADADAAAVREAQQKELERQKEEAARIEKEKQATLQKELEEQQRKAAEDAAARKKADDAKAALAATTVTNSVAPAPANVEPPTTTPASIASTRGEMTNSVGMVFVPLPSGIWAGKYEVTQAEYRKVMATNPSRSVNDRQPVERVSWQDARDFCRRLTELEKNRLPMGRAYTLPTEAQWNEFAVGQKFTDLPAGVIDRSAPAPVGLSGPNKFGMFDVLGNVWEWCLDDATSGQKLLKGGAFKSANFDKNLLPDQQVSNCGFRCVIAAQ